MTAPTPPGWYPDPSDFSRQRYFDGRQWTEHYANYAALPPPPSAGQPGPQQGPNLTKRALLTIGGIVAAFVVLGLISSGGDDDKSTRTATAPTSTSRAAVTPPHETAPRVPEAPPAGMNQEVRDGKFAFVVTEMGTSPVAGDPSNQFMREEAQGVFVLVQMTVTNVGDRAQTFFADNQKLIIDGREYSPNTMAAVWNDSNMIEINPGNTIQALVAFDVPNPPGGPRINALELHDSAFSGGVTVYPR
ncbi:hypothetical protein BCA37_11055 [Mycobacterium sp. djl-10]|nr:hypothetical protein BCA37_11055 [Mycobacterium sp. djl-10]